MKFTIEVRVCRQRRALYGFYTLINGQRIRFERRADAIDAVRSVLEMQRLQVCTVDQFAAKRPKGKKP